MLPFARLGTAYYFAYFWAILPLLGLLETPRPLPATIATSVTGTGVEQVNAPAE
jgi:ubiquinol-cytochrome c reductase cytochrome b subunit